MIYAGELRFRSTKRLIDHLENPTMNADEQLRDALAKPEKHGTTLWDISDELLAIGEKIAENQGELSPSLEAELDATEGTFEEKAEWVFLFAKDSALNAEKARALKEHASEMEKYWLNKSRGLKDYLLRVMEKVGRDKVQTFRAKFSRVQSPTAYRWTGDTFEQIPERFRKQNPVVYSLNVDEVKRAVAAGETLPEGIVSSRGYHIR